ncbi:hypothetical protein tinsulaeT_17700 [Thalassotalea insulae]|uniref:HemY N-terminal domain-containing protein n=1 Tax=Thalassotalea insulae TaxID=2056778 RepID=A0ABQ6GV95_9GAMM|nr:heme biosynthesis HemY N-terminal domain-containing protein [Thalassotalea insulae]GLX78430.1 hypothetical protein tinsulaeT_17700 [Thalassotalea insulae]
MKRLILVLLLFFAAVAISPVLIGEKGYILIAMGDITIESTVVTASIMLLVLFIALAMSLKLFKGGMSFSLAAWNKLLFAGQRKGLRQLNQGIAAYVLGDNQQAEHLLVKCAESAKAQQIAYLLAASAADKQGLASNSKHYLAQLQQYNQNLKDVGLESVLVTLSILLKHKEFKQARALIDQHHKFIGHDSRLLALEIELSLIEQRYDYVVEQLKAARKNKEITPERIEHWEAQGFYGAFNQQINQHDNQALQQYWDNLGRKVKQRTAVVFAYCRVLAEHQIHQPLSKILLPVIKKESNDVLLKQMRTLPLTACDELIQAVQKHLHNDQQNAQWLSTLAHLCAKAKQWPTAEKAFNTLVHLDGEQYDKTDLLTFAEVLQQQGELAKANEVLRKAAHLTDNALITING